MLLEQTFENVFNNNKQLIELSKNYLELLNKEKELFQKNNITYPDEQQAKIDETIAKINALETNPFLIDESLMLKIDFKDYLKIMNMIKNDLRNQEDKDIN